MEDNTNSLISFVFTLFLIGSNLLSAQTEWSIGRDGYNTTHIATVQEAQNILTEVDDFVSRMTAWDRQSRLQTMNQVSVNEYLQFVSNQVLQLTQIQQTTLANTIEVVQDTLQPYNFPFPDDIFMCVTSTADEGGANYTRSNIVVIDRGTSYSDPADIAPIVMHEFFHILTRHNPQLKDELYANIGFYPCNELVFPPSIEPYRITNPDAPVNDHCILIQYNGVDYWAVPIIYANGDYNGGEFFNYLVSRLLLVDFNQMTGDVTPIYENGAPIVVDYYSPQLSGFFEQVGEITDYIIHPEEILADHFKLAFDVYNSGEERLQEMREILKKYELPSFKYSSWQATNFTGNEIAQGIGEKYVDADGDQKDNYTEYLFGTNPRSINQERHATFQMTNVSGNQYPGVRFTRRYDDDIIYQIKTSNDLQNWKIRHIGTGTDEVTTVGNPVNNGDGTETVIIRLNQDISQNDRHFMCVTATHENDFIASPTNVEVTAENPEKINLSWDPVEGAHGYNIFLNGDYFLTTTKTQEPITPIQANTEYSISIQAVSKSNRAESEPTYIKAVTPPHNGNTFTLGGIPDSEGFQIGDPNGMHLYAAIRGNTLYVATWAPQFSNDHFLYVANEKLATASNPVPWAKSGNIAFPENSLYLGAESEFFFNEGNITYFTGWFNDSGASSEIYRHVFSEYYIESTIDIVSVNGGTMPDQLCFAVLAYATEDGGTLVAQAPLAIQANADVENNEILCISTDSLRDENGNGIFDINE